MLHLFDDDDRYTQAANEIDRQSYDALRPIFEFWVKEGYSRRDIFTVMSGAANELMLWSVLEAPSKADKAAQPEVADDCSSRQPVA